MNSAAVKTGSRSITRRTSVSISPVTSSRTTMARLTLALHHFPEALRSIRWLQRAVQRQRVRLRHWRLRHGVALGRPRRDGRHDGAAIQWRRARELVRPSDGRRRRVEVHRGRLDNAGAPRTIRRGAALETETEERKSRGLRARGRVVRNQRRGGHRRGGGGGRRRVREQGRRS